MISTLFVLGGDLLAQEGADLHIYGNVKDYFSRRKLATVRIEVKQDGASFDSQNTSSSGKFEFFLPLDHRYSISFSKDGYVTKMINIDSKGIPEEDRLGGFSMNPDMSLFEEIEDVDFAILKDPIGKAKFKPDKGTIEWDFDYTRAIQAEIDRMMKSVEKAQDEAEKQEDQAAKNAAKLLEDFNKFMDAGNKDMTKKSYSSAVSNYQRAVELKSDDKTAKDKLAEAQKKLAEQEAAAEAERQYNEFIDRADNARSAKNWQEAVDNYKGALGIKEGDSYAKSELKKAEEALEKEKERAADEEAVAALISQGDDKVNKEDFQGAIAKYEEALSIIPGHEEAQDKLAIAQKAKDEYEALAAKRAEYDSIIKEADKLFDAENYSESISEYEAALKIFSDKDHPKDRIAQARDRIAELEAKAQEEAELAEKQANFDRFITAGDANVGEERYNEAITNYEKALDIFPDDQGAQDKLASAQAARDALLEAQEADARYLEMVEEADRYFEKEDWEASIEKYRAALEAKEDPYPNAQIAAAEAALAEAERLAEEQRLAEEAALKAEEEAAAKQAEYDQFIADGDDDLKGDEFDSAIRNYEGALRVFPEDQIAQEKLDKAQKAYEDYKSQLAADELKAQEEAAAAAKQAEFDGYMEIGNSLFDGESYEESIAEYEKAQSIFPENAEPGKAIERARKAIEDREARLLAEADEAAKAEAEAAEREKRERFNQLVSQGDAAYSADTYQPAVDNYTQALEIFPEDGPTQKKLKKAQDALLLADEEARKRAEEEERLAREREAQEARDAEEAERLRREQELRDAEEAERLALEQAEAIYGALIAEADELFDFKEYKDSKRKYQAALDQRPDDPYPQERIDKINELLDAEAEAARLRAEREAKALAEEEARGFVKGADLGSSDEGDIDARIARERQKRLEEKWAAAGQRRENWTEAQKEMYAKAGSRVEENQDKIDSYRETKREQRERANEMHEENSENMADYKEGIQDLSSRYESERQERVLENRENLAELREGRGSYAENYYDDNKAYERHSKRIETVKESKEEINEKGADVRASRVEDMDEWKSDLSIQKADRNEVSKERRNERGEEIIAYKEGLQENSGEKNSERVADNYEFAQRRREQQSKDANKRSAEAEERRTIARLEANAKERYTDKKEPMDYLESELAADFPQGVTEETFTEGNKEVIRRVVVLGNIATEYRKVTSVAGTYYFKNGRSISRTTWEAESDKVLE